MTDIVERLREIGWSLVMGKIHAERSEAADEIERLREQQKLIIGIFRVNMMRWAEGYSDEDFDKKIAHLLGEKE